MKISLNWLKDYIDLNLDTEKISEILTTIGLEVEGIEQFESVKGGLKGVVVGHILECGKHPNADKLSLTKVDIGDQELQIVCGAPNVAVGQKVLVATIGTTLYDGEGNPWKIKKGKIRGEESQGMICAEDELGLGSSHDGIMVLPDDTNVGTLASEVCNVETDVIYEIGLTPNRSDATSHIGVAQDVAAYLQINHNFDGQINLPDLDTFNVDNKTNLFEVVVEDAKRCPRYSGISISDVTIAESPEWLRNKLKAIGIRPISNIVDITNYILHEYGQPLHAFDADKVADNKIVVKCLEEGSKFTSLDEKERTLHSEDLMICDGDGQGMCIAGVFGGLDSGVTSTTKNIFLESAHFEAKSIRKSSTRHLLRTDAAKVFEKGSDPNITVQALKRAAILIKELAGGTITSSIVDVYPDEILQKEIQLRYSKVNDLIGNEISVEEIHQILSALGMGTAPVDENSIKVKVPTNKADVIREVDLIEEILRIYGFNKISTPDKVLSTISYSHFPDSNLVKSRIRTFLSANGFNEMLNLSLIESGQYEKAVSFNQDQFVKINNTSNIHLDIMRPEMLLSGLNTMAYNINRQQNNLKLYEFGKDYLRNSEGINEKQKLSLFISGSDVEAHWNSQSQKVNFFSIKSFVANLLERLNVKGYQVSETEDSRFLFGLKYHRGPKALVDFGKVNAEILKERDVKQDVFYAEFDFEFLLNSISTTNYVSEISKFPSMRRDLALVIDDTVAFEDIVKIAKKTDKKILKKIGLFDLFKDEEKLGKDKKSYAVSFVFENNEKTLNDKEVDKLMKKMQNQFESELNAQIRK